MLRGIALEEAGEGGVCGDFPAVLLVAEHGAVAEAQSERRVGIIARALEGEARLADDGLRLLLGLGLRLVLLAERAGFRVDRAGELDHRVLRGGDGGGPALVEFFAKCDVADFHTANRLRAPDAVNWLGTDRMGSDLLSRILFGARITITIALVAVGSAVAVGVPIGLVAGYYGGWPSNLLMRVSDIFLAVPQIVLAIAIAQTLGPSIENVILALSITYWPFWARLVFAETRSLKNEVFIESAIALGASPLRVMTLHVLPNIASAIIVRTSIGMGATILTAAALGFLGLGAPPPTPEWGRMIAESREFLPEAWWYATVPGVAIFMVVMGFNLLGDGLRDFLDPRIRRGAGVK